MGKAAKVSLNRLERLHAKHRGDVIGITRELLPSRPGTKKWKKSEIVTAYKAANKNTAQMGRNLGISTPGAYYLVKSRGLIKGKTKPGPKPKTRK